MCGIVGYVGDKQAAPILLEGLTKLEYRGYDSAGIAVYGENGIRMEKVSGRLVKLKEATEDGRTLPGTLGIGHTRWATHGSPNDINAHPHFNESGSIVVVHNGIIENYSALKAKLVKRGYVFRSETDTEVLAHLLDFYYKGDPLDAISRVMYTVEGSYALGILFSDFPEKMFAARKDSPLIVGEGQGENFIASDVPAILQHTRTVFYIQNEEIVELSKDSISFFNMDKEPVEKESVTIEWDVDAAEKGGYPHFMLKEIFEEPRAVRDTLAPRIKNGDIVIEELGMSDDEIRGIHKIQIVACGSAYHTGVTAKYVFEGIARIPVEVDLASEYRYRQPHLPAGHPGHRGESVGRDRRFAGSAARVAEERAEGSRHRQRGRKLHRQGGRQCHLHLGRPGDFRGHHKGLQRAAGRLLSAGVKIREGTGTAGRRGVCGISGRSFKAAGTDGDDPWELSGAGTEIRQPLSGRRPYFLHRARHRLRDLAGGLS